jgi:F0F1-type ATP synthase membrane subunit c/vacuolar-type H+-ATPase subunit K
LFPLQAEELPSVGWAGFLDGPELLQSFGLLVLATALGAAIGFHPTTARTIDTRAEAELPKVCIMYALVGAVIGEIVLAYGLVVGFVIFGLGGLMRFRTDTSSTRDTGRLIIVTLVGLIAGLNLPHFAVLAAAFAWLLILILDGRPICELEVHEIPKGRVKDASAAYRTVLQELECQLISENKSFSKSRIDYVFRAPRLITHAQLHQALCERVPPEVRGEIDWEVE